MGRMSKATWEAKQAEKAKEGALREPMLDLSDYSADELTTYLQMLFKTADANGDGVLTADEFTKYPTNVLLVLIRVPPIACAPEAVSTSAILKSSR